MHAIVVAGTHSGVGKTSVTLALTAVLRRRGLTVQPFKVGPDFIDPAHHTRAAGRPAHNLDGWMLPREANLDLFATHTADADVAVIEGMMGLFDGADPRSNSGSAAEMASWLSAQVLLVIDASAMARSAAALVHGYTTFDPDMRIAGVIANRVGSAGHAGLIAEALEPCLDVDRLLTLSRIARAKAPAVAEPSTIGAPVRIGIARDEAFSFYYEDNLAQLTAAGAELVDFSPLHGELPRHLDGLYIGGGYPELHAAELAANTEMLDAIREMTARGRPIYGECGGLIYLGDAIEVDGRAHSLCGALSLRTRFPGRLQLGYAEVQLDGGPLGSGHTARGHWFHKAETLQIGAEVRRCYSVRLARSDEPLREGYTSGNALASWVHLHFHSCPELPRRLVAACAAA